MRKTEPNRVLVSEPDTSPPAGLSDVVDPATSLPQSGWRDLERSSIAVMLVFSNGEGDEQSTGSFLQGVVCLPGVGSIEDVASRREIARMARGMIGGPTRWLISHWAAPEVESGKLYNEVFIHGSPARPEGSQ